MNCWLLGWVGVGGGGERLSEIGKADQEVQTSSHGDEKYSIGI